MEKHPSPQSTSGDTTQAASVFAIPELFQADMQLRLSVETHTALFVSLQGGEAFPQIRSVSLTPASTRLFLALLQAYPWPCSYQSLYHVLYPSPKRTDDNDWWEQVKDLALPMIRRALKKLAPALRAGRVQVIALRGQGYLLAPATRQTPRQGEAPDERKTHPSCCSLPLIRAPVWSCTQRPVSPSS
ncbi:MAG TPA: helix-turn-helix domain-containing protein [Ktedonobacteraceae bacterium]|nr:helix-turn-helix domain-containing protein [Ktedonobacteraceae bacterium]